MKQNLARSLRTVKMCRGKNKVKREEIVAENLPAREDSVRKTFLEFPTSSLKNRVAIL